MALIEVGNFHIQINGQVQGVGFRPFIFQLAQKFGLCGWVSNAADGLHIEFNATDAIACRLYHEIIANAPPLSHITSHDMRAAVFVLYENFTIRESHHQKPSALLLSPDFAICENCRRDVSDSANRRYQYAFTTCTQCGPRYSINEQLPYDRDNTSMKGFQMCVRCEAEYTDPANRRHFSQTNSCPDCPVTMKLYDKNQNVVEESQVKVFNKIAELWRAGHIVAIKGIGGFLLTCDASNAGTIRELRLRKHRPSKPFALMFPDLMRIQNQVYLSDLELIALQSTAAPIVLLRLRDGGSTDLASKEIAPRLSRIGAILAYTPLFHLLLQDFNKPIVATSANSSNAPMIYKDEAALNELPSLADFTLVHDREIVALQDDSVVIYSPVHRQRIIMRRARGFSPFYSNPDLTLRPTSVLALGGLMKSTFTLLHLRNVHVSQYLGDTDNYEAQIDYKKTLEHFTRMFEARPTRILVDKHPDYFTTLAGEQLQLQHNAQLIKIQHHEAHFASVLGEHNLHDATETVLGVILDGTGLGDDGHIWGGEFFVYRDHTITRVEHFAYFNQFLGNKMAQEPRLSAFSLCHSIEEAGSVIQPKFSETEWLNYNKLILKNTLKTSSVGRLFDAVASILGLIDKTSYEGEAALLLEEEAQRYFKNDLQFPPAWTQTQSVDRALSTGTLITAIVLKKMQGIHRSEIAAWFHVQLVVAIRQVALKHKCQKICCSGGVFQNGLLVDIAITILGAESLLYFNKDLSPNDENLSAGQAFWDNMVKRETINEKA